MPITEAGIVRFKSVVAATYCILCGELGPEHVHRDTHLANTVVIVDLDSTLANTYQRHHAAPSVDPTSTWERYASFAGDDEIVPGAKALANALYQAHQVHIVSARRGSAYDVTIEWLSRHEVDYDVLRLISDVEVAEGTSTDEYKVAYAERLRAAGFEVVLVVDDWPGVHDAMAAVGIPTLVVDPMYRDGPSAAYARAFPGRGRRAGAISEGFDSEGIDTTGLVPGAGVLVDA